MSRTAERGGTREDMELRAAVVEGFDTLLADAEPKDIPVPPSVAKKRRGRPRSGKYPPTDTKGMANKRAAALAVYEAEAEAVSGVVLEDAVQEARRALVLEQAANGIAYDPEIASADGILPVRYSRRVGLGLVFEPGLTYEQWESEVKRLMQAERIVLWLLGDALNYGEAVFPNQWSQALDASVYAYQTYVNLAYVARQIPNARRRPTLPFGVHAAVAGLEVAEQERLLKQAEEEGITVAEMRAEVRKTRIQMERDRVARLPDPGVLPTDRIILEVGIATATRLPDKSVDAIITSPPYGLDGSRQGDKYRVKDEAVAWEALMYDFLSEAGRVLRWNGRLIVNLPLDTTVGGYRPLAARFTTMAIDAGFEYATTIIWHDTQLGKSVARGSVDSASAPRVITPVETILVFSKGDWGRETDRPSDLLHEEWLEWTNGYWQFPGETDGWEGFTAAFPQELPRRLLKLFTFVDDVVCDPFLGSGTTALLCWRLGRTCYGFDIDPAQVASSKRRIKAAALGPEKA